jgi:hypothetical protein
VRTMTEEEIKAKEVEMRREFPASFTHPELRDGEMACGPFIPDDNPLGQLAHLKAQGMQARMSSPIPGEMVITRFLIVSIREQILASEQAVPA